MIHRRALLGPIERQLRREHLDLQVKWLTPFGERLHNAGREERERHYARRVARTHTYALRKLSLIGADANLLIPPIGYTSFIRFLWERPVPQAALTDIQDMFTAALRHHQDGRLADAERLYRQILQVDSRHADSWHLLGVMAQQAGKSEVAIELIGRAIAINGNEAAYRYNLGIASHSLRRLDDAVAAYNAALLINPDMAEAYCNLGNALKDLERYDEAVVACRTAVRINPELAEGYAILGSALNDLRRFDEAVAAYNAALRINPELAEVNYNLGNALRDSARLSEAVTAYETALRIKPDYAEAHANLGSVLRDMGRPSEAIAACNAALRIKPDLAETHYNLANALGDMDRFDDAVTAYQTALRIKPDYAEAHANLGSVLNAMGRPSDAIVAYGAALRINPDLVEVQVSLGNALKDLRRFDDAVAAYDAALCIKPACVTAHSSLIYNLHYMAGTDRRSILAAARRFAEQFERKFTPSFSCSAEPDRRLRIGYVSGDFRHHPVGTFLKQVLANHDHTAMEIYCYSNHPSADAVTAQLRDAADQWRNIVGLSDRAAADLVAADRIDVLVDLSGHTALNRLLMFALKPAPVQVTWLGFWGTTGLSTMDYILSDAVTIPPGEEGCYSERVIRLPGGRFCYGPPDYAPRPSPPPCLRGAGPTFGSFNQLAKIGPDVVQLWAAVLHAVPGSRLLLKSMSMIDAGVRRSLVESFAAAGIDPQRLTLRGSSRHAEMLAEYGDVDVALDPFPFSGGTTSCEALWMGVPIVTLPGELASSRQTLGFLQVLGLSEWAATSPTDYVRIAAGLSTDVPRLTKLRTELRSRMEASTLCDGARFTRELERAFRTMWQAWCAEHPRILPG